jgi:cobalt-zinc-cadmium efflux system outer membrane protein
LPRIPAETTSVNTLKSKKRIHRSDNLAFPYAKSVVASCGLVVAFILALAMLADPQSGDFRAPGLAALLLASLPTTIVAVIYLEFRWRNKRRKPERANQRKRAHLTRSGALRCLAGAILFAASFSPIALCQKIYSWPEIRDKFEATNPTLQAARVGIDEFRAQEVTAYLRPNPTFTSTLDQIDPFTTDPYRPLASALPLVSASYLHERQHKRELRRDSAQQASAIATSQLADQERTLLFNLRNAFVQALQQKAILTQAQENLVYYDQVLKVSRDRKQAGDISQVDLDRLEVQRVQYETDVQTATVNLRTAKIQLLTLLNDRAAVEQFDVTGLYDFPDRISPLEEFRSIALDTRPDLKAAMQSVDKAKTDNRLAWANGSTDPIFAVDAARNPPIPAYFGLSVTIPLRIFDRNQGEKARTLLDINRNRRLRDATEAQVFSDVDSAYATINSNLTLLRTYKANYLQRAQQVRDTVLFAYQNGGASLLDFLQAQQDYRSVRTNYLNLIGAYLTAASQLNLAVGREVIL